METNGVKHLEHYFYSDFHTNGKYDFPIVKKQAIELSDLKLIRYSSTKSKETTDNDATVHFFEYDDRFDEIWKSPDSYLDKLRQYKQIMTPDFSMYTNIALALQVFNTFRTRWLGAYWQRNGLTVIPTVSWSDEWSYEFCFDGIEPGSVVALSTMGCMDVKEPFMTGYIEMCKAIDPKLIICYAKPFEEMINYADVIEVPYQRNVRIAPAIERNED
jgi:hypothetical protein